MLLSLITLIHWRKTTFLLRSSTIRSFIIFWVFAKCLQNLTQHVFYFKLHSAHILGPLGVPVWNSNSCALDQVLLLMVLLILSRPNWFRTRYDASVDIKASLAIICFNQKAVVTWPSWSTFHRQRDALRDIYNRLAQANTCRQATPIGINADIFSILLVFLLSRFTEIITRFERRCQYSDCNCVQVGCDEIKSDTYDITIKPDEGLTRNSPSRRTLQVLVRTHPDVNLPTFLR